MTLTLIIFHYLAAAVTDVMDKVFVSRKKIDAVNYTFFTVVTGAAVLLMWPWVFFPLEARYIFLNLLSGVFFSLTIYLFFRALTQGEVSRVIPFIFGLVPLFDIIIGAATGRNALNINEISSMFLLVPGALIISYRPHASWGKHVSLKLLVAVCFSIYFALWQYSAQTGPVLNNFMWNRVGAAGVLVLLLIIPAFRKKVFAVKKVEKPKKLGWLFLLKQVIGGGNFILFSYLIVAYKISVVSALQGIRYVFLFLAALVLSHYHSYILKEELGKTTIRIKLFALAIIFIGTLILFI